MAADDACGLRRAAGPDSALLVGSPDEVVNKILRHAEALGGISRISFQMNVASLPQAKMMRAIDAIGAAVAPTLHQADPTRTTREQQSSGVGAAENGR